MKDGLAVETRDARGRLRSDHQTFVPEGEKSLTVQSDAHLADIQEIMKTFGVVGMDAMLNRAEGQFMDVSQFVDYATMMNHVKEAETEFMKLPSKVREMFDHDVYTWLDRAHDERRAPSEREQLGRAGDKAPDPEPVLVEPRKEPTDGV